MPSAQSAYVTDGFQVLTGSVSGLVDDLNQSKRRPPVIVMRLTVQ